MWSYDGLIKTRACSEFVVFYMIIINQFWIFKYIRFNTLTRAQIRKKKRWNVDKWPTNVDFDLIFLSSIQNFRGYYFRYLYVCDNLLPLLKSTVLKNSENKYVLIRLRLKILDYIFDLSRKIYTSCD